MVNNKCTVVSFNQLSQANLQITVFLSMVLGPLKCTNTFLGYIGHNGEYCEEVSCNPEYIVAHGVI